MGSLKSTQAFYDQLTPHYHLIFEDWDASMRRQGQALRSIIRKEVPKAASVLDLACGIGTQALALAKLGFKVTARDLSPASVARARREANARKLRLQFGVADMRQAQAGSFDVVMACDNAIPHLLTDSDILKAFKQAKACLKPGGLYLISVRDYAKESKQAFLFRPYGSRKGSTLFQTWTFKGRHYEVSFYVIGKAGIQVSKATYYAVSTARLMTLMRQAGFKGVRRIDGKFYQPILLGKN